MNKFKKENESRRGKEWERGREIVRKRMIRKRWKGGLIFLIKRINKIIIGIPLILWSFN